MSVQVVVKLNHFPAIAARLVPAISGRVQETADRIQQTAQGIVHVRSGELRDSIAVTHEGTKATVGTDVEHGIYNEFGTIHMGAIPFLGPAVALETDGFLNGLLLAVEGNV